MADESPDTIGSADSAEEKEKLTLEVEISQPGACQRHVTVTIARSDIDRYLRKAVDEIAPTANVPGFRPGRAPRDLVEKRFHEQVAGQVKSALLMDSMTQVTEEHQFAAISEPDFDIDVIKLPDDGPLVFEFDIEVRPDFEVPEWRGLNLERPTHTYTEEEIDRHLRSVLARHGHIKTKNGPGEPGDQLVIHFTVRHGENVLLEFTEDNVQVLPVLTFRDARIEGFDNLVIGAQAGDRRETKATISDDASREDMRGKEVAVEMRIQEVRLLELPKLTTAFLDRIGGFEDEDELRDAVRKELDRQLAYTQQRRIRQQITDQLTRNANWELPPDLLKRQFQRELERSVMELKANGFDAAAIRTHQNEIRQNSARATATALKEHFILERLAEENDIDVESNEYDREIQSIASQSGESPRRVRARMEKRGQMDALRNQIVERKVIQLIMSKAHFTDKVLDLKPEHSFAVDRSLVADEDNVIPEAQHGGEAETLRQPAMRG